MDKDREINNDDAAHIAHDLLEPRLARIETAQEMVQQCNEAVEEALAHLKAGGKTNWWRLTQYHLSYRNYIDALCLMDSAQAGLSEAAWRWGIASAGSGTSETGDDNSDTNTADIPDDSESDRSPVESGGNG